MIKHLFHPVFVKSTIFSLLFLCCITPALGSKPPKWFYKTNTESISGKGSGETRREAIVFALSSLSLNYEVQINARPEYSRDAHTTTSVYATSSPDEDTLICGLKLHRTIEKSTNVQDRTYKTTRSITITITHPTDQERLSIRHPEQSGKK